MRCKSLTRLLQLLELFVSGLTQPIVEGSVNALALFDVGRQGLSFETHDRLQKKWGRPFPLGIGVPNGLR